MPLRKCPLLWLSFFAISAHAATYNVNSSADVQDAVTGDGLCVSSAGTCTLRAAIQEANFQTSGTSLIVVPRGTYRLSIAPQGTNDAGTGDLNLAPPPGTSIIVQGAGAGLTVIDGNQLDRIFRLENNAVALLIGLTIRNGLSSDLDSGGGVFSTGILTMIGCTIENNRAPSGGGVYVGAVDGNSIVTLIDTTVQHNQAPLGFGGGVSVLNSNLRIYNSTLNGNSAYDGGGIHSAGTSYIVNSTIANNTADADGGGVYNSTVAFLYNTSVIGNDADHDQDDVGGFGGGVANDNDASARFGLVNSLLSDNTVRFAPVASNCSGTFELYGTNLSSSSPEATCATTNAQFALLTPTLIGSLHNNGGPTLTQALLPGSEAIDSTLDALGCVDETGAPLTEDQRGAPRPAGVRCDVGAYEYGAVAPISDPIFADGFD